MDKIVLTKDEFVKYMDVLKTIKESSDRLHDALASYDECSDFSGFSNFRVLDTIEELLSKLMNDPEDEYGTTMVNYFTNDLNFGADYEEGMITNADGSIIDLSTVEKLYDYLSKND